MSTPTTPPIWLRHRFGCDTLHVGGGGGVIILASAARFCFSRMQQVSALSTSESEYMALSDVVQGLHLLRQVQRLMRPETEEYYGNVMEENKGAIKTANNPINSYRTNNMDVRHHFLRQHVQEKTINIIHVGTGQQHADVINKALNTTRYKRDINVFMNVS